MTILSVSDFQDVRQAIDISLDETVLPDQIIGSDMYQWAGEQDVLRQDPLAETRTGAAQRQIRLACIYYIAARLAIVLPQIKSEATADGARYDRVIIDWATLVATLRARGDAAMAAVLESGSVTAARPTFFAVASGQRGR